MYNENKISLAEATVLALQGKLKLEETRPARRTRRIKNESVEIETDNVEVELEDNGDTTIETDKEVITVSQKAPETDLTSIEEPVEDVADSEETINVPVEGDETILPEEEVSEETFEEDNVEDLEESKKCVKEDYEIDQEGNLDIIECEDAVNFVKKNINNMKDIYEDDIVNIYTTGHDYDFIAVILNKTNNVITIKFNDNEIEPITIDKSNWIGLLADTDGYCTLQQVINKDFFIVEDEKPIEDDLEESKKVCEENKECLTEEPVKYEWVLQGNYGYGWDDLVTYDNKEEAERDYKDYRENEPEYAHRIRKRVVKEETKDLTENVTIEVADDGKEIEVTTDNAENVDVVDTTEEPKDSSEVEEIETDIEDIELEESKLVKIEARQIFNKKSFEETLTKFYKFNNENVKSFKVESIMTNKNGSLKIEGKLNDNVPATMIFDKKVEGKSFITYSLRKSNVLKESKEIKTTMLINKKENILNCRNIISK